MGLQLKSRLMANHKKRDCGDNDTGRVPGGGNTEAGIGRDRQDYRLSGDGYPDVSAEER